MIKISITRFLVILTGALVLAVLLVVGYGLVGRWDPECSWISSYIEISIGLNGALAISKLRRWQRKALLAFCNRLLKSKLKRSLGDMGEDGVRLFATITTRIFKRFEYRFNLIGKIASYSGPAFAVLSTIILLTGCQKVRYWTLPLLLAPFVVFYSTSFVCYLCARDHFYEISYDLDSDKDRQIEQERENFVSLKKLTEAILKGSKGNSSTEGNEQ